METDGVAVNEEMTVKDVLLTSGQRALIDRAERRLSEANDYAQAIMSAILAGAEIEHGRVIGVQGLLLKVQVAG